MTIKAGSKVRLINGQTTRHFRAANMPIVGEVIDVLSHKDAFRDWVLRIRFTDGRIDDYARREVKEVGQ